MSKKKRSFSTEIQGETLLGFTSSIGFSPENWVGGTGRSTDPWNRNGEFARFQGGKPVSFREVFRESSLNFMIPPNFRVCLAFLFRTVDALCVSIPTWTAWTQTYFFYTYVYIYIIYIYIHILYIHMYIPWATKTYLSRGVYGKYIVFFLCGQNLYFSWLEGGSLYIEIPISVVYYSSWKVGLDRFFGSARFFLG